MGDLKSGHQFLTNKLRKAVAVSNAHKKVTLFATEANQAKAVELQLNRFPFERQTDSLDNSNAKQKGGGCGSRSKDSN